MCNSIDNYIALFAKRHAIFRNRIEEVSKYFEDGLDTVVLGFLGLAFLKNAQEFSHLEIKDICELVETGMQSDDLMLSEAVATGFIESMVNVSGDYPDNWSIISKELGKESLAYAKAWAEWEPNK